MLNLARKWRSKQFDQLIGQGLSVRLIKNSLYRNLIFPVYLFSGPRGCGKTSMARLFASALNCDQLENFQKNPQGINLPCLECSSCNAMKNFSHPDFIEIDAASNTGVDNVRQIIDSASFVPVLARKKIYLIDEAHMLSKAAFNALLKILEEPPKSVVFMLATTDPHKIIDTVKSRCFQLFFNPVSSDELLKHLAFLCTEENINFESDALLLIANQTEGSVRDAINLLERVRMINNNVNKQAVFETLGFIDDERLISIFNAILNNSIEDILNLYSKYELEKFNPGLIFKRLIDIIRQSLWLKNNLQISATSSLIGQLTSILNLVTIERLIKMLDLCYTNEFSFSKSVNQHNILEIILIKLAQTSNNTNNVNNYNNINNDLSKNKINNISSSNIELKKNSEISKNSEWLNFLSEIQKNNDPLILSIFRQARFVSYDKINNKVLISFNNNQMIYSDWLESSKVTWQPILEKIFSNSSLDINFNNQEIITLEKNPQVNIENLNTGKTIFQDIKPKTNNNINNNYNKPVSQAIDIKKSEKANILLKVFPGTISIEKDEIIN